MAIKKKPVKKIPVKKRIERIERKAPSKIVPAKKKDKKEGPGGGR